MKKKEKKRCVCVCVCVCIPTEGMFIYKINLNWIMNTNLGYATRVKLINHLPNQFAILPNYR